MNTDRRRFLRTGLLAGAASATPVLAAETGEGTSKQALCVFNKPLQHLDYEAQAKLVAEIGFDGIEGTVRKGGHVEPERVEEDLPRQVEALRKHGLEMTLMTTDVNTVDSKKHRAVLETGAKLGVKRFRMGSIKLTADRPIPDQLDDIRRTFRELVAFCRALKIQPLYQNHAGAGRFGAAIWDLHSVLEEFDPSSVGIAFDIRHATVEGGQSWPTEFQLVRRWIGTVYCKDFAWIDGEARPKNVPLGTGRVEYPRFFKMLRESGYDGPVSLHMEYKDHRDPSVLPESIAAVREDYATLRELVEG